MSVFGKNIKKIRGVKKISQTQFAEIFGLTRASIGAYEEGRAEPKIDTLTNIANYFNITIDALINKELTINELYHFDIFKDRYGKSSPESKTKTYSTNKVLWVDATKLAKYSNSFSSENYINSLDYLILPNSPDGNTRAFTITSPLKYYNEYGYTEGDVILCKKKDFSQLKNDFTGNLLFVSNKEMFLCNIIQAEGKHLNISPDGLGQKIERITTETIQEMWHIQSAIYVSKPKEEKAEIRLARMERAILNHEANKTIGE